MEAHTRLKQVVLDLTLDKPMLAEGTPNMRLKPTRRQALEVVASLWWGAMPCSSVFRRARIAK